MKKRQELIDRLQAIFRPLNSDKLLYQSMMNIVKNRIPLGKFAEFYNGYTHVRVQDEELYWMVKAFNESVKSLKSTKFVEYPESINISEYFTVIDINRGESYSINVVENDEDIFVIDNVVSVGNDEYICYNASYKMISDAYDKGVTIYNYDTQRQPEATYSHLLGEVVYRPRIYTNTITEIYDDMISKKFIPNMITWNILKTGMENFVYDKSKRQLIFRRGEGSQINMIDGFHRTLAINKIISEYPNFDGHMQIKIFCYDVEKAKRFITQEAKGNKISPRQLRKLNTTPFTKMAEEINGMGDESSNLMFNRVAKDWFDIFSPREKRHYVHTQTMGRALEINYANIVDGDMRVYNNVKKWVVEYLNELLSIANDEIKKNNNKHIIINNNMFTLYLTWSRMLYKDEAWKTKLHKLFEEVDWSEKNEDWARHQVTSSKSEKRIQSKIAKLAEELFETIIERAVS